MNTLPSIIVTLLLLLMSPVAVGATPQTESGIRIDLPVDGHVLIDNQYGSISATVWDEKYLLVSATIEGEKQVKRSPVVIERRDQVLAVSIVRTPIDPPVTIALMVKIPATMHAELGTTTGSITVGGLPASISLHSTSGGIRVELSSAPNADIDARATQTVITSQLDAPLTDSGHTLRAHLGSGERELRIKSETGQIILLTSVQPEPAKNISRPPVLSEETEKSSGAGVPATASDSAEVSEGDVIRVDSQLVTMNMSVVDRNTNRGVLGLAQNDFKLYEDGVEQRIIQFDSASAPFDLILLIDLSGSTRDVVKLIRSAALRFVDAARPSDRIGIFTFAGQPTVVSPLTLDRGDLRRRIATIDTAPGDTKLYDAIDFTLRQVASDNRSSRRTAIVLMSDGLDGTIPGVFGQQGSKISYKELLGNVQEFDGVLYALWLNTYYEALNPHDTQPEAFETANDRMQDLAEAGGGTFYQVERLTDLAGAYEQVVADLGTVYSVSYRPSNNLRDGSWRAIRVAVNRPAAIARGKRGYYAK